MEITNYAANGRDRATKVVRGAWSSDKGWDSGENRARLRIEREGNGSFEPPKPSPGSTNQRGEVVGGAGSQRHKGGNG
jgi:hypothetical protein